MANQLLSWSNKIFSIVHAMLKAFVYVAWKRDKLFGILIVRNDELVATGSLDFYKLKYL